jgi:hypothetical protein
MKVKIFVAVLFLFHSFLSIAQNKDGSISWDAKRPLTWEDFKGRADNSSEFDAQTFGSIMYNFETIKPNKEYKLILGVTFNPKNSWVKAKKDTDKLLAHEQIHFDIFELYLRILVKRIEGEKMLNGTKFSDRIQKAYKKVFGELVKFQQKYDKETNHSKNEEKQKEWNEKVKKMLEEYKEYAKREIAFKI